MQVELSSRLNPDFPPAMRGPAIPSHIVPCNDPEHASAICRAFIEHNCLGAGNWSGGAVLDMGRIVGRISYNGNYWPV